MKPVGLISNHFLIRTFLFCIVLTGMLFSCKDDANKKSKQEEVSDTMPRKKAVVPPINADSVYAFVEKQLSFGTRVPGSEGHKAMKDWLVSYTKSLGYEVKVQPFSADFLGKKNVPSYNIIASLNPKESRRMVLAAHWDTRLIAEKDADDSKKNKPIMGADDGASGVAGLLEIMRVMSNQPIELGVDFIFFDAEDQGDPTGNWCIGSQYWGKNPHIAGYKADWGILLDLVGAENATFHKEEVSMVFAGSYVDKVWSLAQNMGYGKYFKNERIGTIQDDHYYVNTLAKIPMIDIIYTTPNGNFGHYHHTHKDDIGIISKETLRAVTQVTIAAVYKYSDGSL